MNRLQLKPTILMAFTAIVALVILLLEWGISVPHDGTLILTLSFWIMLIQGSVALAAAAETAKGKWIEPLKKDLLAFYPLILLFAVLSLFLKLKMDTFVWMEHPGRYLNENFFLIRNFVLILLTWFLARGYAKGVLENRESRSTWAVLYLFAFVTSQTVHAVDWMMSLEYPWMSTMFPPLVFVESFFSALALLGLIGAYMWKNYPDRSEYRKVMADAAVFMFGFALAWVGLFYGQFLVIWYGNIPHETIFFTRRVADPFYHYLLYVVLLMLFVIPFVGFLYRKSKQAPAWVSLMAFVVLGGLFFNRIYIILPNVHLSWGKFVLEFVLILVLMVSYFASRHKNLGFEPAK